MDLGVSTCPGTGKGVQIKTKSRVTGIVSTLKEGFTVSKPVVTTRTYADLSGLASYLIVHFGRPTLYSVQSLKV